MKKTIYMDAAASSLKSTAVIDAQVNFMKYNYANSGRGICARINAVDASINRVRESVASFINADKSDIIFTNGATDSLNRIVNILKASDLFSKDSIVVVSDLDHHSARLPWEERARRKEIKIKTCRLDKEHNLSLESIDKMDILLITAMSNVIGSPQDVEKIIKQAKKINPDVITIVDAAQYVAHLPINVAKWECDFLCFSGHKIGGDTGVGIMYMRDSSRFAPDNMGGGMVLKVSPKKDTDTNAGTGTDAGTSGATSVWSLAPGPSRFEAGTLPLTQIIGLGTALEEISARKFLDKKLISYLYKELSNLDAITMITNENSMLVTFTVDKMHCLDFGAFMGANNVCVRAGNMCATWIHDYLGIDGSIRISCGFWNTMEEVESVVSIIKKILDKSRL